MNFQEAMALFAQHRGELESKGVTIYGAQSYVPDEFRTNFSMAMDAQPTMVTDPNGGIPAFLTTMIDPQVYRVAFAPTMGAEILGEVRKGTWLDETAMFPVIEHTGEVSSYGDWNENGRAGANMNWPQRQAYLFQTIEEYGDRELERAGLGRINWVAEMDVSAATVLNRYANYTYHYGVAGLQNYGLLNDPSLPAALTPATKAAGGVKWINNSGVVVATANEIFQDIQSVFAALVAQSGGLIDANTPMKLVLPPAQAAALTTTNSFNVNVADLLKKNFPNFTIMTDPLYGAQSTTNPQGVAAGNFMQLIAASVDGQPTGFAAFNEKMRTFPIVRQVSSYKKKIAAGTWGAVIRAPMAIASMVGI